MAAIRVKWALFQFEAATLRAHSDHAIAQGKRLIVTRHGDKIQSRAFEESEEEMARQWLGDMGLDGRQARRLLDAALRGVGPFADSRHPRRVNA